MKIYLAGPMTNLPGFNFPAFHAAAAKLRASGYTVFNPAEDDEDRYGIKFAVDNPTGDEAKASADHGYNRRAVLARDLTWICHHADGIALLPGWEASSGANAELSAALALKLQVIHL